MPDTRPPLTRHQIEGLKTRLTMDESDFVEFEAKVGGSVTVYCWLNEQTVSVTGDKALSGRQIIALIKVLEKAHDFLTYGPGRWLGEPGDSPWESALDKDGNDRVIPDA